MADEKILFDGDCILEDEGGMEYFLKATDGRWELLSFLTDKYGHQALIGKRLHVTITTPEESGG